MRERDNKTFEQLMIFLAFGIVKGAYDYLKDKAEEITRENGFRIKNEKPEDIF